MRIKGLAVTPPPIKTLVFPNRLEGGVDLVLKFQSVLDMEEFDLMCPIPEVPTVKNPSTGHSYKDPMDADFNKALDEWALKKSNYLVLKSLSVTEDLELETVKLNDPETWKNLRTELESVFSNVEISMIFDMTNKVCCMNRQMIEEATASFLRRVEKEQKELDSQMGEVVSMQSGEPVRDLV